MKRLLGGLGTLWIFLILGLGSGCSMMGSERAISGSTESRGFESIVAHVDPTNNIITLQDEDNNEQTYLVGTDTSTLDQVQANQRVHAEYVGNVILVLEPADSTASGNWVMDDTKQRVPLGDNKNDERKVIITTIPAAVKGVDAASRTLILQDPEGRTQTMTVIDKQPLDGVKAGDILTVTFTEAIRVRPITGD